MDYESQISNLNRYIGANLPENGTIKSIEQLIIDKARSLNLEIIKFSDCYYIKKGDNPKALLHLNLDYSKQTMKVSWENEGENKIIKANFSINLITSFLVITYLLTECSSSFDILLTHNNIHISDNKYTEIRDILRTDKIINLNLRQGSCVADEFSGLKLLLNQVKVDRFVPDYSFKTYRLSLDDLTGGHAGEESDKVKLNSIKLLMTIIRKIKAKVDLDIVSLVGGERYDFIPSTASLDLIVNEEYEADLINIFEIVKNETIEKNLKYEPDLKLTLVQIENKKQDPITKESFNHLASFIELIPIGSYFVNSVDDQIVSSCNLATARSLRNNINLILVLRSLSDESMKAMVEKFNLAATISSSTLTERYHIDKWKNNDNSLTDIFKSSFREIRGEEFKVIKTQYSLDSSIIFKGLNVKIISLGVKYKKGDDVYYSFSNDILNTIIILENVFNEIN
ncbi:hypothetical protein [uncultured Anaerococcus sp.]|uniref:hypothetical protein n=1 Tax=uncultured Anaerococcus sp. TaxID=293428 RepID=UPI0026266E1A|nr:hypothetical protein [uncultured Anaerococcus sp.]